MEKESRTELHISRKCSLKSKIALALLCFPQEMVETEWGSQKQSCSKSLIISGHCAAATGHFSCHFMPSSHSVLLRMVHRNSNDEGQKSKSQGRKSALRHFYHNQIHHRFTSVSCQFQRFRKPFHTVHESKACPLDPSELMYSFLWEKLSDRACNHPSHLRAGGDRHAISSALIVRPVCLAVKSLQSVKHPVIDKRSCTAFKALTDPCCCMMLTSTDAVKRTIQTRHSPPPYNPLLCCF